MTTNKLETYVGNIQGVIESITNQEHINQLSEVQVFLFNVADLFGRNIQPKFEISEATRRGEVTNGKISFPVTQFTEPQNPISVEGIVPAPAAPGAMKLSSGVQPQVDGCIAAQPNTIMQQAAQQRLNQLLAEQDAERKAKQEALNQALEEKKREDELTQSLLSQMQKTAPMSTETKEPEVKQIIGQQQGMTLADFVAMQQAQKPSAPAGQMTLDDFVKSETEKQSSVPEAQAQLDALLAEQLASKQESIQPGTSSPLA